MDDSLGEVIVLLASRATKAEPLVQPLRPLVVGVSPQLETLVPAILPLGQEMPDQHLADPSPPPLRVHEHHRDMAQAGKRWPGAIVVQRLHTQSHTDNCSRVLGHSEKAVAVREEAANVPFMVRRRRRTTSTGSIRQARHGAGCITIGLPADPNERYHASSMGAADGHFHVLWLSAAPRVVRLERQGGISMTNKAAFTPDEWISVIQGPTSAGLVVVAASRGGTFRESFAMSKAYVEARSEHGKSELLDEIVHSKPKLEHAHTHSTEELMADALQRVRAAVAVLESKATADEVEDYRQFVMTLAQKVAVAHREGSQDVSPAEAAAIEEIRTSLGAPA